MLIQYKTQTVQQQTIAQHLLKCKDNFIPALDTTVNIDDYSKKLANKAITFEAWADGELVGLVAGYFNDELNRTGYITNVSVVSTYGGKGIASQLLNNCIAYAKGLGYHAINLEVNENNGQALKLYRKHSFQVVASNEFMKTMRLDLL